MAGWGAMMGLGQGLQQVGGMVSDYNKTQLADKLEQGREQRRAALDEEKRQRQLTEYATTETIMRDGVMWELDKDKANRVIDERLASQDKIEAKRVADAQASRKAEKEALEISLGRKKLDTFDEDRSLGIEKTRAQIEADRARAQASRASATRSLDSTAEPEITPTTMKDALRDRYSDRFDNIAKQYTGKDAPTGSSFGFGDLDQLINDAVKKAASTPGATATDIDNYMDRVLRDYERRLKAEI